MIGKNRERLDKLSHQLDLIERVLLVREPGSVKSADAYEGLRRQVVTAVSERQAHLAHLAQLDAALERGESVESLRLLMKELMGQAALQRVTEPSQPEAYEVVGGRGENLVVVEPAYLDGATGRIIRQGTARAERQPSVPSHPAPADATVVMQ